MIIPASRNDYATGFADGYRQGKKDAERKKGRWIPFDIPWYKCSECGAVRENKSFMENFCPNCGARMEG